MKKKRTNAVPSVEQQAVIDDVIKKREHVLVTGSAGTGKSFLLSHLKRELKHALVITATTGIAALNVGGCTVHRFAGLGSEPERMGVEKLFKKVRQGKFGQPSKAMTNIKTCSRLAIDEISMFSAELMDILDQLFRLVRDVPDKPFGGVQLIMFGDFLQAPPVKGKFAFKADVWGEMGVRVHELKKCHRQEDQAFANILGRIRTGGDRGPDGSVAPDIAQFLLERLRAEPPKDKPPVVLHTHNAEVDQMNRQRMDALEGKSRTYTALDTGPDWARDVIDRNSRMAKEVELKVGARVMLLINIDPESGLANGSLGTVEELRATEVRVKFDLGAKEWIGRETIDYREKDAVIASRSQIPLRASWAITVHRSQGQTLDSAQIYLRDCFCPGQAYVALSRVRSADGLYIATSARNCIQADQEAIEFYQQTA